MASKIRWTILCVSAENYGYRMRITVTTDIPIHLNVQYAYVKFTVTKTWSPSRGANICQKPKYAPREYRTVDQLQPSDTLVHTFEVPLSLVRHTYVRFRSTTLGTYVKTPGAIYTEDIIPAWLGNPSFTNWKLPDFTLPHVWEWLGWPATVPPSYAVIEKDEVIYHDFFSSAKITTLGIGSYGRLTQWLKAQCFRGHTVTIKAWTKAPQPGAANTIRMWVDPPVGPFILRTSQITAWNQLGASIFVPVNANWIRLELFAAGNRLIPQSMHWDEVTFDII